MKVTVSQAGRGLVVLAALDGLLAVAAGAFGAHAADDAAIRELMRTGAQYQMVHAVAALVAGLMGARVSGWLFAAGALVFGASLYLLALTGVRLWGAVTPIGGLLLLAGWAAVGWTALRRR